MKMKCGLLALVFTCLSVFTFAQSKTDRFRVWGNCEMCKSHIEKAAVDAGATSASWNEATKLLVVVYNEPATTNIDIQKKIALAGYDTQDVKATDDAFKKLDKCCQYKRPSQGKGNGK
jgi:hypothetical protein